MANRIPKGRRPSVTSLEENSASKSEEKVTTPRSHSADSITPPVTDSQSRLKEDSTKVSLDLPPPAGTPVTSRTSVPATRRSPSESSGSDSFLLSDLNLEEFGTTGPTFEMTPSPRAPNRSSSQPIHPTVISEGETFGDPFDSRWEMIHPSRLAGLTPRNPQSDFEGPPLKGNPVRLQFRIKEPSPGRIFNIRVPGPEVSLRDAMNAQAKNAAKIMSILNKGGLGRFEKAQLSPDGKMNILKPQFNKNQDLHAAFGTTQAQNLEFTSTNDTLLHRADGTTDKSKVDFFKKRHFDPRNRATPSTGKPSSTEAEALAKSIRKACAQGSIEVRDNNNPVPAEKSDTDATARARLKQEVEAFPSLPSLVTPHRDAFAQLKDLISPEDPQLQDLTSTYNKAESFFSKLTEQVKDLENQHDTLLEKTGQEDQDLETLEDQVQLHAEERNHLQGRITGFNESSQRFANSLNELASHVRQTGQTARKNALEAEKTNLNKTIEDVTLSVLTPSDVEQTYKDLVNLGNKNAAKEFVEQVASHQKDRESLENEQISLKGRHAEVVDTIETIEDQDHLNAARNIVDALAPKVKGHNDAVSDHNAKDQELNEALISAINITQAAGDITQEAIDAAKNKFKDEAERDLDKAAEDITRRAIEAGINKFREETDRDLNKEAEEITRQAIEAGANKFKEETDRDLNKAAEDITRQTIEAGANKFKEETDRDLNKAAEDITRQTIEAGINKLKEETDRDLNKAAEEITRRAIDAGTNEFKNEVERDLNKAAEEITRQAIEAGTNEFKDEVERDLNKAAKEITRQAIEAGTNEFKDEVQRDLNKAAEEITRQAIEAGTNEFKDEVEKDLNKAAKEITRQAIEAGINEFKDEVERDLNKAVQDITRQAIDAGTNEFKDEMERDLNKAAEEITRQAIEAGTNEFKDEVERDLNKAAEEITRQAIDAGTNEFKDEVERDLNKAAKEIARQAIDAGTNEFKDEVGKDLNKAANKITRQAIEAGANEFKDKVERDLNKAAGEITRQAIETGAKKFKEQAEKDLHKTAEAFTRQAIEAGAKKFKEQARTDLNKTIENIFPNDPAPSDVEKTYKALVGLGDKDAAKAFVEDVASLARDRERLEEARASLEDRHGQVQAKIDSAEDLDQIEEARDSADALAQQVQEHNDAVRGHDAEALQLNDKLDDAIDATEVAIEAVRTQTLATDKTELNKTINTITPNAVTPSDVDKTYQALVDLGDKDATETFMKDVASFRTTRDKIKEDRLALENRHALVIKNIEAVEDQDEVPAARDIADTLTQDVQTHNDAVSDHDTAALQLNDKLKDAIDVTRAGIEAVRVKALDADKTDLNKTIETLAPNNVKRNDVEQTYQALVNLGDKDAAAGFVEDVASLRKAMESLEDDRASLEDQHAQVLAEINVAENQEHLKEARDIADALAQNVKKHNDAVSDHHTTALQLTDKLQGAINATQAAQEAARIEALNKAKGTLALFLDSAPIHQISAPDYMAAFGDLVATGTVTEVGKQVDALNSQREEINTSGQELQSIGSALKDKTLAIEDDELLDAMQQDATLLVNDIAAHNTAVQHFNEDAARLTELIQSEAQQARDLAQSIAKAASLDATREALTNKLESITDAPEFITAQDTDLAQFIAQAGQEKADQKDYPKKVQNLATEREVLGDAHEALRKQMDHLSVDIAQADHTETLNTHEKTVDSLMSDLNEVIEDIRKHNTSARSLAKAIAKEKALVLEQEALDQESKEVQEVHQAREALQSRHATISDVEVPDTSYNQAFETFLDLLESSSRKSKAVENQFSELSAQEGNLSATGDALETHKSAILGELLDADSQEELEILGKNLDELESKLKDHNQHVQGFNVRAKAFHSQIDALINELQKEAQQRGGVYKARDKAIQALDNENFSDAPLHQGVNEIFQIFVDIVGEGAAEVSGISEQVQTQQNTLESLEGTRETLVAEVHDALHALEDSETPKSIAAATDAAKKVLKRSKNHRKDGEIYNQHAGKLLASLQSKVRDLVNAPLIDIGKYILDTDSPGVQETYTEIFADLSKLSSGLQEQFDTVKDEKRRQKIFHGSVTRFMERNRARLVQRHPEISAIYELPPFHSLASILIDDLIDKGTRIPVENFAKGGKTAQSQATYAKKTSQKHQDRISWLLEQAENLPVFVNHQSSGTQPRALLQSKKQVNTALVLNNPLAAISTTLAPPTTGAHRELLVALDAQDNKPVSDSYKDFSGYQLHSTPNNVLTEFASKKEKARIDSGPPGSVVVYRGSDDSDGAHNQVVLVEGAGKLNGHPLKLEGTPLRTSLPGYDEVFMFDPSVVREQATTGEGIPFEHFLPLRSAFNRKLVLVNAGDEVFAYEIDRRNELAPLPLDGDPNVAIRARAFLVKQLLETRSKPSILIPHLGMLINEDITRVQALNHSIRTWDHTPSRRPEEDTVIGLSLAALKSRASGEPLGGVDDGTLEAKFRSYLFSDIPRKSDLHPGARAAIASELGLTHLANRLDTMTFNQRLFYRDLYDDVKAPISVRFPRRPSSKGSTNSGDDAQLFRPLFSYIFALSNSTGRVTPELRRKRVALRKALTADIAKTKNDDKLSPQHRYIRSLGAKLLCLDPLRTREDERSLLRDMRNTAQQVQISLNGRNLPSKKDAQTLANKLKELETKTASRPQSSPKVKRSRGRKLPQPIHIQGGHLDTVQAKHNLLLKMRRSVFNDKATEASKPHADKLANNIASIYGDDVLEDYAKFITTPEVKNVFDFENDDALTPHNLHKKVNGQVFRYEDAIHNLQEEALSIASSVKSLKDHTLEDLHDRFLQGTTPDNHRLNEVLSSIILFENHLGQLRSIQEDVARGLQLQPNAASSVMAEAVSRLSGMHRSYPLRDTPGHPGIGLFERRMLAFERMFSTQFNASQYEMLKGITSEGKRLVNCGTGFGKTFCLQLVLWSTLLDNRSKTQDHQKELILIQPTQNLKEKTKADYASFGSRAEVNFTLLETPFAQWDQEWTDAGTASRLNNYAQQLEKGRQNCDIAWLLSDKDELALRAHYTYLNSLGQRTDAQEETFEAMTGIMDTLTEKCDKYIDEHDNVLNPEVVKNPGDTSLRKITKSEISAVNITQDALKTITHRLSGAKLAKWGLKRLKGATSGFCLHLTDASLFHSKDSTILRAFCEALTSELSSLSYEEVHDFLSKGPPLSAAEVSAEDKETLHNAGALYRLLPGLLEKQPGEDFISPPEEAGAVRPLNHGKIDHSAQFGPLETAFLSTQEAAWKDTPTPLKALSSLRVPNPDLSVAPQELLDCKRVTGLSATEGNPSITAALTRQNDAALFTDPFTTRPRLIHQLAKISTTVAVAEGDDISYLGKLIDTAIDNAPDGDTRPFILVDGGGDLDQLDRHRLVHFIYAKRKNRSPDYRVSFFTDDKKQWIFAGHIFRAYEPSLDDAFASTTDYYIPPTLSEAGTDVRQVPSHMILSTGIGDLDLETQQIGRGRQLEKGQVLVKIINERLGSQLGVTKDSTPDTLKEAYYDEMLYQERQKAPQVHRSSEETLLRLMTERFKALKTPRLDPTVASHLLRGRSLKLNVPRNLGDASAGLFLGDDLGKYLTEYDQRLWKSVESQLADDLQKQYLDCILEGFAPDGTSVQAFRKDINKIVNSITDSPDKDGSVLTLKRLHQAVSNDSGTFHQQAQDQLKVRFPRNLMKSINACARASSQRSIHNLVLKAKGRNSSGQSWLKQRNRLIESASRATDPRACVPLILQHESKTRP